MKARISGLVVCFLVCAVAGGSGQEGPLGIEYRFDGVQPLKYEAKGNSLKLTRMSSGPEIGIQTFLEAEFTARLDTSRADTLFQVNMAFDELNVQTRLGTVPSYPQTDILIGREITVIVDPKGNVEEAVGLDLLPQVQLVRGSPESRNLGEVLRDLFAELPDRPVSVGEKWEESSTDTTVKAGQTTVVQTVGEYEFKKIAEKEGFRCAQINAKLSLQVEQRGEGMGNAFSFEGKGKGKVELFFALEEGIVVQYKTSRSVAGEVVITGPQGQKGTVSETGDVTYKLIP